MLILPDSVETHERAAQTVRAGSIIAFRTDTFYGLGADPFNSRALQALRLLKGREEEKPILVVVSDAAEAGRFFAERSAIFESLTERHWPGTLTIVAAARAEVPEELTAGKRRIGVRLPADDAVRAFIRACGGALTATSANLAGEPPARTAQEVARSFPNGLALIVDAGATQSELPSTVLDINETPPRLIREGALSRDELRKTLDALGAGLQ
jgi:L-threonylcarbamoyladenylate synthase